MLSYAFALLAQAVVADVPDTRPVLYTGPGAEASVSTPDLPAEPTPPVSLILPKGHPIVIVIDAELGSKISGTGQMFPIRLAEAVVVDGVELLPAGIKGEGQVVHAKKGGMAGSAGELVLAARYLDHGGRRIPLRSFKFIEAGDEIFTRGKDNIGIASATNAVIGPLGFLIGGGNTTIVPGTIATAKTRDDEAFGAGEADQGDTTVQQERMQ